jgi:hypothetical protein
VLILTFCTSWAIANGTSAIITENATTNVKNLLCLSILIPPLSFVWKYNAREKDLGAPAPVW